MLYIFGYGGFAREVRAFLKKEDLKEGYQFVVDDEYYVEDSDGYITSYSNLIEDYCKDSDKIVIAIGDPSARKKVIERLNTVEGLLNYKSFANLNLKKSVKGKCVKTLADVGNIFCPGSVITTNVYIGAHNHFNLNTTIGHDCKIGSYNTFSPGVNISGNVTIGNNCYFGTNSSVRQGVKICDNVTIGMGAVVLNDITEPGTYVGVPCKKLSK